MQENNAIILILARGGSKGIPKKNLQEIDRIPLIGRTVDVCVKSRFGKVFVYSDDDTILHVAEMYGGEPVKRPMEVSGDHGTSEEAVKYFLETQDEKARYKAVGLVQCTTPFLKTIHINTALDKFIRNKFDTVIIKI